MPKVVVGVGWPVENKGSKVNRKWKKGGIRRVWERLGDSTLVSHFCKKDSKEYRKILVYKR